MKRNVPRIAFVCSGGGYRAAIGSLGFSMAAQKKGLLDAVTYFSCSSGSSWFLYPWLQSEIADLKKFLQKFIIITAHDSLMYKLLLAVNIVQRNNSQRATRAYQKAV
jgi:hypothetical protein